MPNMTQLWQTHGRLCRKLARRYSWMLEADPALEQEDLVQSAFLGLAKAQETFDPAAGKSFAGWAAWFVARELRSLLGWRNAVQPPAHCYAVRLDAPIDPEDPDDTLLDTLADDTLPPVEANLEADELKKLIDQALDSLQPEQADALRGRYMRGLSEREIARLSGVDAKRAHSRIVRGMAALRRDRRFLRRAADLADVPNFSTGYQAFTVSGSATERAALWRIEHTKNPNKTQQN